MPLVSDLIILVDVVCIIVSLLLLSLSWSSLRIIGARKIERTIFTPVLIAGLIFIVGSALSIFHSLMIIKEIFEVLHHVSWAVALIILTYGVYGYWRMLKKIQ